MRLEELIFLMNGFIIEPLLEYQESKVKPKIGGSKHVKNQGCSS
jgi:hypothetical protein